MSDTFRRTTLALSVSFVALIVSLSDTSITIERGVFRQLLVFDITQSMMVVDNPHGIDPPTRLQRAQSSALDALADMDCGSEVGVGLFTGHRTLVLFAPVEVCAHYGDMASTISAIDWRMAWEARSEVAKGLHSALISAKTLGGGTTVVFITDGHEAPPLTPTLLPRYRGRVGDVRGAVAGIGGDKLVPIPKLDAEGRRRGFWKRTDVLQVDPASMGRAGSSVSDESFADVDQRELQKRIAAGQEHLSSLKEDYLQQLSKELALSYRRVDDGGDMLALLQHPDLALRRPAEFPLRHPLAGMALVLIIAVYADSLWRSRRR